MLKELWDKRRGRILLNETYDAIGGLQGAVATKADELFKGESISNRGLKEAEALASEEADATMEHDPQPEAYLVHVWIPDIHPMLWQRFLVRSDSTRDF